MHCTVHMWNWWDMHCTEGGGGGQRGLTKNICPRPPNRLIFPCLSKLWYIVIVSCRCSSAPQCASAITTVNRYHCFLDNTKKRSLLCVSKGCIEGEIYISHCWKIVTNNNNSKPRGREMWNWSNKRYYRLPRLCYSFFSPALPSGIHSKTRCFAGLKKTTNKGKACHQLNTDAPPPVTWQWDELIQCLQLLFEKRITGIELHAQSPHARQLALLKKNEMVEWWVKERWEQVPKHAVTICLLRMTFTNKNFKSYTSHHLFWVCSFGPQMVSNNLYKKDFVNRYLYGKNDQTSFTLQGVYLRGILENKWDTASAVGDEIIFSRPLIKHLEKELFIAWVRTCKWSGGCYDDCNQHYIAIKTDTSDTGREKRHPCAFTKCGTNQGRSSKSPFVLLVYGSVLLCPVLLEGHRGFFHKLQCSLRRWW